MMTLYLEIGESAIADYDYGSSVVQPCIFQESQLYTAIWASYLTADSPIYDSSSLIHLHAPKTIHPKVAKIWSFHVDN